MNPEDYIPIKVDILLLRKYFDFQVITKEGKPWEIWPIKRKYYDQVKDLLSEYGIHDQQSIDNFCHLESITWGKYYSAREMEEKNEDEKYRSYYTEKSNFGKFLIENNIRSIIFNGDNKATGARNPDKIILKNQQLLDQILMIFQV
jgi:hypothetical protein